MTEYVILRRTTEMYDNCDGHWQPIEGIHRASSAKRAIDGAGVTDAGDYVAVPARSWKPLPVKVESKTVVTVG